MLYINMLNNVVTELCVLSANIPDVVGSNPFVSTFSRGDFLLDIMILHKYHLNNLYETHQ
jgi:hypothetical protein